jgi:hypothetical protein
MLTLKGKCMGEFFQCDTGETFPLPKWCKVENKECFINGYIDNVGVLHIIKAFWIKR